MSARGCCLLRVRGIVGRPGRGAADASGDSTEPASNITNEVTRVHRLESSRRSIFDAFVYVNRIPVVAEDGETADDLSGRIFGRLANQEGRVLIKLPPGMTRAAYRGFKVALENEEESHAGRCFTCHRLPEMDHALPANRVASLRNRVNSESTSFSSVARDKIHADIAVGADDVADLDAFLQLLTDKSDSEFRQLIIDAEVVNMLGAAE